MTASPTTAAIRQNSSTSTSMDAATCAASNGANANDTAAHKDDAQHRLAS